MRTVPISMAFLVVCFCPFMAPTASAQTRTCTLALDVFTTNKKFETRPVNGARAAALNTRNRKSTPAVLSSGQPVFSKFTDGEYRITVTKLGYKRVIQPVSFRCERINAEATLQVDLNAGNLRQSIVARSQSIMADTYTPVVRRGVTTIIGTADPSEPPNDVNANEQSTPPATTEGAISGGVLNGRAVSLPRPAYPPIARQAHASGIVVVQVLIDEEGNVIWARVISGHPLLQAASRQAALNARFFPTRLSGQAVKVTGLIRYNFVSQ